MRDVPIEKPGQSLASCAIWFEGSGMSRHLLTGDVLPGFGRDFAIHRETVELLRRSPNPDRKTIGRKLRDMGRGEIGHLLLRHRQWPI